VTTTTARPVRIDPPPPGWNAKGAAPDADRTATTAMVLGIVSLFANLVLIPSIIGIVYGRRALRSGTSQRGTAVAGIVTGVIGLVLNLVAAAIAVAVLAFGLNLGLGALQHGVEAGVVQEMAKQGTTLTDVACPVPATPRTGTTMTCTGQAEGIGPVRIEVAWTSETRYTAKVFRTTA